jgi:hypothetical protein
MKRNLRSPGFKGSFTESTHITSKILHNAFDMKYIEISFKKSSENLPVSTEHPSNQWPRFQRFLRFHVYSTWDFPLGTTPPVQPLWNLIPFIPKTTLVVNLPVSDQIIPVIPQSSDKSSHSFCGLKPSQLLPQLVIYNTYMPMNIPLNPVNLS